MEHEQRPLSPLSRAEELMDGLSDPVIKLISDEHQLLAPELANVLNEDARRVFTGRYLAQAEINKLPEMEKREYARELADALSHLQCVRRCLTRADAIIKKTSPTVTAPIPESLFFDLDRACTASLLMMGPDIGMRCLDRVRVEQ